MAQSAPPRNRAARWAAVTVLLAVAVGGALWVPLYARPLPRLGAFPFFYWYQLIWVPAAALLCWIASLVAPRPGR